MADIFISYSREDRDVVRALAGALERAGYSVWWDWNLIAGRDYRVEIERQLEDARTVIALWTENSVTSVFVNDEATHAASLGKLVPVAYRGTPPPMGFRSYHTIAMDTLEGVVPDILAAIEGLPPPVPVARARTSAKGKPGGVRWPVLAGVLVLLAVIAGAATWQISRLMEERFTPTPGGPETLQEVSVFRAGGAWFYLIARGPSRRLYYLEPDEQSRQRGAVRHALFFRGRYRAAGRTYSGRVFSLTPGCAPLGFEVSGPVTEGFRRVTLEGEEPVRSAACDITGRRAFTMTLEYQDTRSIGVPE